MTTSTLKMSSSKSSRNLRIRVSDLKMVLLVSKSLKLMFWQRLLKLSAKFFSGRERFSSKRKCKMLLIQKSVKPKSLL
jgi:hypothetical protein